MAKRLSAEKVRERFALIAEMESKGRSQAEIAGAIGISHPALCQFKKLHGAFRGETSAERMARKKKAYCYNNSEPWQVANPAPFAAELLAKAQRLLACDAHHAAWVLSCPIDWDNRNRASIGHRNGSAIG